MIIVAGDSWAVGEWNARGPAPDFCPGGIAHGGLGEFLRNAGHDVINVGEANSSNWSTYEKLSHLLANQTVWSTHQGYVIQGNRQIPWSVQDVDRIFIFQTEWFRDWRSIWPNSVRDPLSYQWYVPEFDQYTIGKVVSQWLYHLSDLAQKYHVTVELIGGCSDTIWLDDIDRHYPGVKISCQSFSNLCVSDNPFVNDPVLAVRWSPELVKLCRDQGNDINYLLEQIKLGEGRESLWHQNPQWFYPDGEHANRWAHEKLFRFLFP